MSKYSEKVARREEAARLAALAEPEPELQPEPTADRDDVPGLGTFTTAQMARYRELFSDWQDVNKRMRPGSKARRVIRAQVLQEIPHTFADQMNHWVAVYERRHGRPAGPFAREEIAARILRHHPEWAR